MDPCLYHMLPVVTFDEPSNEESVVIDAGHDTHQKYICHQKARLSFKNKDDTKHNASCYPCTWPDVIHAGCSAAGIFNGTE